ncbi:c-type cytochrome [Caldalkalibacillus salinus]|uniref:c-type cytochrome n=1 Tax=Caldalkalibacillus salinus TaxID=2803787 RepID=UPI0019211ADE|nr:cytochrome c [Caldalkalibacillus salinus]
MNPIKVFLSIFTAGIALTLVLGIVGFKEGEELAGPSTAETHPDFMQSCINCHGADLRGTGQSPNLRHLDLTEEEILDVVTNGVGAMPGGQAAGHEEEVVEYLQSIQDE